MSSNPHNRVRIDVGIATQFVIAVLRALKVPPDAASCIAGRMIEADLSGAEAHGIFRLPQYVAALFAGQINATAQPYIQRIAPAAAILDGDNGFGHLAMSQAVRSALDIASETGVAWIGVKQSNHAGAGGVYGAMVAKEGMVGIYGAVSGVNHMAPDGLSEPVLGTNPLAIAVPGPADEPFVLDIGMSTVASGILAKFALEGRQLPAGWVTARKDGVPITDPLRVAEGMLTPMGGHKGLGLAFMIGLLAGPLTGAAFGKDLPDFASGGGFGINSGQFLIAVDVNRFVPLPEFRDRVATQLEAMGVLERDDSMKFKVRLPGVDRARRQRDQLKYGLSYSPELLARLNKLAQELGVDSIHPIQSAPT